MGWAEKVRKAKAMESHGRNDGFLEVGFTRQEAVVLRDLLGYLAGRNVRRVPWSEYQETAADATVNSLAAQFDELMQGRGL